MAKTSIQRRLIAAIVISQLVLAVGLVDVAVFVTRAQLRRAFDVALQGRAMSIAALVRYSEDESHKLLFEHDLAPPPLESWGAGPVRGRRQRSHADRAVAQLARETSGPAARRATAGSRPTSSMEFLTARFASNTCRSSIAKATPRRPIL